MSPLLSAEHVSKVFARGGLFSRQRVTAVDDVSFSMVADAPEVLTIIGESGSGKSTLARMILGIHAPSSGRIVFEGEEVSARVARDRHVFMAKVQPIFQNPFESFNPLKKLDRYLFMTAERFGRAGRGDVERVCDEALGAVGLSLAEVRGRFPHELSGGQLQRAAIARALVSKPRLIVADEPVSMVDASLRMSIVNLFSRLKREFGLTIIYITHDLATAYHISDRLIIMRRGQIVETGEARSVLSAPKHPYSQMLKDAVLTPDSAGIFRSSVQSRL